MLTSIIDPRLLDGSVTNQVPVWNNTTKSFTPSASLSGLTLVGVSIIDDWGWTVDSAADWTGGPKSIDITDNNSLSLGIFSDGVYLLFDTTNTSERIVFGNQTLNQNIVFDTAGTTSFLGGIAVETNLFVVDVNADTVSSTGSLAIKGAAHTYDGLNVGSADGSNMIGLYHDNSNFYMKWDDGELFFETDEGTNTNTIINVRGKGTGVGALNVFDQDNAEFMSIFVFSGLGGMTMGGASPTALSFQPNAAIGIRMFNDATSGETEELSIYGYRAGDASRNLRIGVGVDAADTASFNGLSNYLFDGKVDATSYAAGGADGVDFSGVVTSITVTKGIVTAAA